MEQLFSERFVTILVVLASFAEQTHDVLSESDKLAMAVQNVPWNIRALLLAVLVAGLLILLWNSDKLRRLLKLKKSEVDDLIDHMTDGFIRLDQNFRYTTVNKKAGEMVRMDPASMIGKNIWELFPDLKSSPTYNAFTDAMRTRQTLRVMDYYPPLDLWYENNVYPTGNGLTVFIRDVTDHMHAEQKLLENARLYKTIASTIPGSMIGVIDKDYRYLLLEGDLISKIGYSKQLLINKIAKDVLPEDRYESMEPELSRAFNGETFSVEFKRGDFDLLTRYSPLYDEHHEIFSIMIFSMDVTPLKDAERRVAESNIILEKKIAERTKELETVNKDLESFTYSVAHDLRAPLRAVEGYTLMLVESYSDKADTGANRLMTAIRNNALRMGVLIDDILAFSRLGRKELNKSVVNVKQLIDNALQQLPGGNAEIEIHELHPLYGDITLLQLVIINLLSNAIKYSSKNEKPKVIITSTIHDNVITYSVCDNGVGFDMKYAHNLFGVFQRLHSHEEFEGTGVGLAIVHKIINRHGGKVWAHSKPKEGATFFFTLPAIPSERL
jgi:PAS domain S-box-containing protein